MAHRISSPIIGPEKIILDTDLGSDCDDAGALATLHALADQDEAEILACIYSSGRNAYGPGCLSAINSYYGRPGIPIGAMKECELGDARNDFLESIATDQIRFGHPVVGRHEVPDLVGVYRTALASEPDASVQIVSIGHLKGLYDLLTSEPDGISPLPGRELIKRKVKAWVAMGGRFPREDQAGWNFGKNGASQYTRHVVTNWPTRIVFSGYEIGAALLTGTSLQSTPRDNPVREAYRLWENALAQGRASWDQTAVLFAVRGAAEYWNLCQGNATVDVTGCTSWQNNPRGQHSHLVQKMPPRELASVIEELMSRAPSRR